MLLGNGHSNCFHMPSSTPASSIRANTSGRHTKCVIPKARSPAALQMGCIGRHTQLRCRGLLYIPLTRCTALPSRHVTFCQNTCLTHTVLIQQPSERCRCGRASQCCIHHEWAHEGSAHTIRCVYIYLDVFSPKWTTGD
jgi:hypothetical protein